MLNHGGTETAVVLTKHRERALKLRKERARAVGGGLEHVRVAVPADVIADAWALAGDGRHLVTRAQREALASRSFWSRSILSPARRAPPHARLFRMPLCGRLDLLVATLLISENPRPPCSPSSTHTVRLLNPQG